MVEESYVSFETAKLLKEKGFNERCPFWYNVDNPLAGVLFYTKIGWNGHNSYDYLGKNIISAPTQQMAMQWLRKVHNIYSEIRLYKVNENETMEPFRGRKSPYYSFTVWNTITRDNIDKRLVNSFIGETPEEAAEAALKYCLKNLIK